MGCKKLDIRDYYRFDEPPEKSHSHARSCAEKTPYSGFPHTVISNFRYYSPDLGRWLSRDPIGEKGGWNLYIMVGNDAVGAWDYLGYAKISFKIIKGQGLQGAITALGTFGAYGQPGSAATHIESITSHAATSVTTISGRCPLGGSCNTVSNSYDVNAGGIRVLATDICGKETVSGTVVVRLKVSVITSADKPNGSAQIVFNGTPKPTTINVGSVGNPSVPHTSSSIQKTYRFSATICSKSKSDVFEVLYIRPILIVSTVPGATPNASVTAALHVNIHN